MFGHMFAVTPDEAEAYRLRTDPLYAIAHELKRIADALEKQSQAFNTFVYTEDGTMYSPYFGTPKRRP